MSSQTSLVPDHFFQNRKRTAPIVAASTIGALKFKVIISAPCAPKIDLIEHRRHGRDHCSTRVWAGVHCRTVSVSVSVQAALRGQRTALSQTRASARRASPASRSVSSRASAPTADCCWGCSVLSVSVSVVQGTHSAAGAWQRKSSLAVQSWTLTGVVVAARQLLQARAADERFFVFPNARLIFPICGTPFSPYIRDLFEFSFFCRICLCSVSVSVCRRRNRLVLGSARASLRATLSPPRVQCAAARHSSSKHQRVKLAPVRCC